MKKSLVTKALKSKIANLHTTGDTKSGMYDFVFKAVRAKFGGRLAKMVTGSAPVSAEVIF